MRTSGEQSKDCIRQASMFDSAIATKKNFLQGTISRLTTEKAISADVERGCFEPCKIAVLVPCYNEEATVAKVIADFRAALPASGYFYFRQQLDGRHQVGRWRSRRQRIFGNAPRQRLCRPPHVLRCGSGHLCVGGRRCDLRRRRVSG